MIKQELIWSDDKKSVTESHIKVKSVQKPKGDYYGAAEPPVR